MLSKLGVQRIKIIKLKNGSSAGSSYYNYRVSMLTLARGIFTANFMKVFVI